MAWEGGLRMANSTLVENDPEMHGLSFPEIERLQREHNELKSRLTELNSRVYLSPAEELERKTIQKLKLAKKDRIATLAVDYSGTS